MRNMLLSLAALAIAVPAIPASAESADSVTIHRGGDHGGWDHHGGDHHGRRHDRFDGRFANGGGGLDPRARTDVIMESYGGEWALYNNRSFEPDSYNDWWHDRPDRAFPRWVTAGKCDRMWYGADVLRC
jgi:hypothetical protein